jgi:hypothetical protein
MWTQTRVIVKNASILSGFLEDVCYLEAFSHICFWFVQDDDEETHFLLLDRDAALVALERPIQGNQSLKNIS